MTPLFPSFILLLSFTFASNAIYSEGETLSEEHQQYEFTVCHTDGSYAIGDSFTFGDLNGANNGGDYKGIVISINATW